MYWKFAGCSASPWLKGGVVKEPQGPGLLNAECQWWETVLFPRSCVAEPPLSRRCLVYISSMALDKSAAVWVLVGQHPAALPEEDDSHPAKFPLKIHPCRQLSDVCDGNTWKDFFTCNSKTGPCQTELAYLLE